MSDGVFKRTKISHGSKEIPKFLWKSILKKQLQVTQEYFNKTKDWYKYGPRKKHQTT